jgi:hypothetical protein
MATTMAELRGDVEEAVHEALDWDAEQDRDDLAHETADGCVPVYTHALLEVIQSEIRLLLTEPDIEHDGTAVGILTTVIYEELHQAAMEACKSWEPQCPVCEQRVDQDDYDLDEGVCDDCSDTEELREALLTDTTLDQDEVQDMSDAEVRDAWREHFTKGGDDA